MSAKSHLISFSTARMNRTGDKVHIVVKSFILREDGRQDVIETLGCRGRGIQSFRLMLIGTRPNCERCLKLGSETVDYAIRRATIQKTKSGWKEV